MFFVSGHNLLADDQGKSNTVSIEFYLLQFLWELILGSVSQIKQKRLAEGRVRLWTKPTILIKRKTLIDKRR